MSYSPGISPHGLIDPEESIISAGDDGNPIYTRHRSDQAWEEYKSNQSKEHPLLQKENC
jgi:hypothetical protein